MAPEGADRRSPHHESDDGEYHLGGDVDEMDQRRGALAELHQRKSAQYGDEEHLEDVALGKGADERRGHDVHQERYKADHARLLDIGLDRAGIDAGGIDVHADAGLEQVHRNETDDQRDRGHEFEIDDRLDGDAPDTGHIGHMRDAMDDRAEDDRRDQHPDCLDEGVAKRLHPGAPLGIDDPKRDSGRHGDQHLDPELLPPGAAARLVDRERRHWSNSNSRAGLSTRIFC